MVWSVRRTTKREKMRQVLFAVLELGLLKLTTVSISEEIQIVCAQILQRSEMTHASTKSSKRLHMRATMFSSRRVLCIAFPRPPP